MELLDRLRQAFFPSTTPPGITVPWVSSDALNTSDEMAAKTNLVNLDALIKRADFAAEQDDRSAFESVPSISIRDFTGDALLDSTLRKPDFQRETNHWTPDQISSLLNCFLDGDLIPSVILWQSPSHLFVIDGAHRLSVLKAWIEDDYGDGSISQAYFGGSIAEEQLKAAEQTRKLIFDSVGSWEEMKLGRGTDDPTSAIHRRYRTATTRTFQIQWVTGDADKAEKSFFKINTKGTPLDETEQLLLENRRKPIPIAARAVIRAGKGHRYWSRYDEATASEIEEQAGILHSVLFEPEVTRPVKTLDLPLGGSKGVRTAMRFLIDVMLAAVRDGAGKPNTVEDQPDDDSGRLTLNVLKKSTRLARRMTGNDGGSLGLHPAVYFYGPSGRHSGPMFMGTVELVGRALANNDKKFFRNFTEVRAELEKVLVL